MLYLKVHGSPLGLGLLLYCFFLSLHEGFPIYGRGTCSSLIFGYLNFYLYFFIGLYCLLDSYPIQIRTQNTVYNSVFISNSYHIIFWTATFAFCTETIEPWPAYGYQTRPAVNGSAQPSPPQTHGGSGGGAERGLFDIWTGNRVKALCTRRAQWNCKHCIIPLPRFLFAQLTHVRLGDWPAGIHEWARGLLYSVHNSRINKFIGQGCIHEDYVGSVSNQPTIQNMVVFTCRTKTGPSVRSYKRVLPQNRSLRRCWEGTEHLLPQLAQLSFIIFHRVEAKPPVFRDCSQ